MTPATGARAVEDLVLPDPAEPPAEPDPPKPARERTALENQRAKAEAIGLALWRRGMGLRDLAHLPETSRARTALTLARFARMAFREAGDVPAYRAAWGNPPEQPPSSKASPTYGLVARWLATTAALAAANPDDPRAPARDLLDERATWTLETECPPSPRTPTTTSSPAPAAPTTSTPTTRTAAASPPSGNDSRSATRHGPSGPSRSATAAGDDGPLTAARYSRSLGSCRSCHRPVRWVDGPTGVTALERTPSPEGRWVVDEQALTGRPLPDGRATSPAWVEHAAVCGQTRRALAQARVALDGYAPRCEYCGQEIPDVALRDADGIEQATCATCPGPPGPRVPVTAHWVMDDGRRRRNTTYRPSPTTPSAARLSV